MASCLYCYSVSNLPQYAIRLFTLPQTIGELDGETVTAQNRRQRPCFKKGTGSHSLNSEEKLFTLGLAVAKEMLAQPETWGRGRVAATVGGWCWAAPYS
jgi:DNA topoisomerase-1